MMDDRALALQTHLQNHAHTYYLDWAQTKPNVRLTQVAPHRSSTLYHFHLEAGETLRPIVVKTPPLADAPAQISAITEPAIKFRVEYEALVAIHDYFNALQDARFAAIRPLDFIAPHHAVVMEAVQEPSLRALFVKASRIYPWPEAQSLAQCFRHAGGWLRAFHAMSRGEHATPRDVYARDFFSAIEKYSAFLAEALHEPAFFENLTRTVNGSARGILPEHLPVGLTHGDYALRNLLIGPNCRVRAIDTQAKWLMPIYEDLAYFLVGLSTTWPQVLSQGLAFSERALQCYEKEFLSGYFEREPIPWETIRLFKIKILLLKWSANLHRMQQPGAGLQARVTTLRRKLFQRYFRKSVARLLQAETRGRRGDT